MKTYKAAHNNTEKIFTRLKGGVPNFIVIQSTLIKGPGLRK